MTNSSFTLDTRPFDADIDLVHVVLSKGEPGVWISTGSFAIAPLRHITGGGITPHRLHLKMARVVLEEALVALDRQIDLS